MLNQINCLSLILFSNLIHKSFHVKDIFNFHILQDNLK